MNLLFHFAYLDPGTGSLIIQSVIGAVAGVLVFGRGILARIKHKLTGGKSATATPQQAAPSSTNKSDTPTE